MRPQNRSGCPINLAVEVLGDRWSIVILRDIMFMNVRHFREILAECDEGIASNILHTRLQRLVEAGLLTRSEDTAHKQKTIYSLTERAIQLVPVLVALGAWGRRHLPVTEELSVRAEPMEVGGPKLWEQMMDELRTIHLNGASPDELGDASAFKELNRAYDDLVARNAKSGK